MSAATPSAPPAKWKSYSQYKDCALQGLDTIPAHWAVSPLKRLIRGNITDGLHETPVFFDEGVPFLSVDSIQNGRLVFEGCRHISKEDHQRYSQKCKPIQGDILLGKAASIGKIALVDVSFEFSVWSPLALIQSDYQRTSSKFLYYAIVSVPIQHQIDLLSNKNTQKNVGMGDIEKRMLIVPPVPEQRAIAAFLDLETAKIDALVAKKVRLIELLQEKLTALINQAVTKGLDPSASMKDSGMEWLGEIPAHWQVKRLKFLAQVRTGITKGRTPPVTAAIELPYLRVANVQNGYLDLEDISTITVGVDEVPSYALKAGDVLMNEGGDYDKVGRGTVWGGQIDPCLHQNHVFAVRPNGHVEPQWLATITLTSYAKHYFIINSKQSTNLASISSTNLAELPVVVPPAIDRSAILMHIHQETGKLDALIAKVREHIEKLREYRAALISAAATGKIDVREEIA